jgi:hypothetical protein
MIKKIVLVLIGLLSITQFAFSQTVPTKATAEKHLHSKKDFLEKELAHHGINTGMQGIKIAFDRGYFKKHSSSAAYYGYNYISGPDMLYYVFSLTTPTYENGDKFVFEVEVSYDSYDYQSQGYRTPYDAYKFHSVNLKLKSYQGKDLNDNLLLEKLNDLSIENGKLFNAGDYEFVRIDSVNFSKVDQEVVNGVTKYKYDIDVFGLGIDFMYAGTDVVEYAVKSSANIHAIYSAKVSLNGGIWKMHDVYFHNKKNENKISNVKADFNLPPYKSLRQVSLKTIMGGEVIADTIAKTSYRGFNDLKRLLVYRLESKTRESFIEGDMLSHLFINEKAKVGLDAFYGLKKTMKDYHLTKSKFEPWSYKDFIRNEGEKKRIRLDYRVTRKLTSDELKKAKKDGVTSKEALKIIKYPAKGYFSFWLTVKLENNQYVIVDVTTGNQVKYIDGGERKHPLYEKP